MKTVYCFKTEDGEIFECQKDALMHEKKLRIKDDVRDVVRTAISVDKYKKLISDVINQHFTACDYVNDVTSIILRDIEVYYEIFKGDIK